MYHFVETVISSMLVNKTSEKKKTDPKLVPFANFDATDPPQGLQTSWIFTSRLSVAGFDTLLALLCLKHDEESRYVYQCQMLIE